MAEMEVHMNSMYRTVGDVSQWDETKEDGVLLLALQEHALEFVRRWRIEGQANLVAQMENSIRLNVAFLHTLESGDRVLARESLDRMDQARRRCHADFG